MEHSVDAQDAAVTASAKLLLEVVPRRSLIETDVVAKHCAIALCLVISVFQWVEIIDGVQHSYRRRQAAVAADDHLAEVRDAARVSEVDRGWWGLRKCAATLRRQNENTLSRLRNAVMSLGQQLDRIIRALVKRDGWIPPRTPPRLSLGL